MSLRLLLLAAPLAGLPLWLTAPESSACHGPHDQQHETCKPLPPVLLEVTGSTWVGAVLELEYRVTPQIEVLRLETTVGLPDGGTVQLHAAADGRDLAASDERGGLATVRLDAAERAAGGDVELRASITFEASGDDGSAGIETQTLVHRVSFGERDLGLDEVVAFDGGFAEPSLEVPAVRDDFVGREER